MIKATVMPHITGPLQRESIELENQRKIQKDYPLADTLPKNIETYTFGMLIGNDYYNDLILDERKKIQENLYIINRFSLTNGNEKENTDISIKLSLSQYSSYDNRE